ncbi:hypothetical protein [Halobaculum sp. MBLA0143]|uniref:hypothetical protein n=1 Tax=Halobaculum sp. MBLA0143 TaxID=3079933 RepID=UPI003526B2D0
MQTPSRRRVVRLAAVGAVAGLAGCGGTDAETPTVNPALRETPTDTPGPYRATATDALARPRRLRLQNRLLRRVEATVTVRDGDTTVFRRTVTLPPTDGGSVGRAVAAPGEYTVTVEADGGRRREAAWRVAADAGDLVVDVDDGLSVRDRYAGGLADQLVVDTTADLDGRGRLVFDNPGDPVRARLSLSDDGEDRGRVGLSLPAQSRVVLPVDPGGPAVDAGLVVGGVTAAHRWQVVADRRLEAVVRPRPQFLCDRVWRDLWVRNRDDDPRDVRVRIGGRNAAGVERTLRVPAGDRVRRRGAVPPGADYRSVVESDDLTETYSWPGCPPVGPVLVDVSTDDIQVRVRPRSRPEE